LPTDANPLSQNSYRPIPGWSLLLFLAVTPAIGWLAVQILPDREMLTVLGAFFGIALLGVAIAVAPLGRAALPALGFRAVSWKWPVLGTLGTLVLSVAVSQLGIEPQGVKQVVKGLPGNMLVALALLAVLAPLVEELIFRGLIYGWVAGRWGSGWGWLVSSIAFAAAHFELAHVVLVLPLGLLFGWLRRRTDSLLPSLVAHILNNAFALTAAVYLPGV
jgi:membrane protease YdiL (CAAX protease family)